MAQTSYLRAMLTSQTNVNLGLGALAAAVVLSIPFGFGVGAVPLIAFAAGEALAAMWIPASPSFRAAVDRREREKERARTRANLLAEIESRTKKRGSYPQVLQTYLRLADRVDALQRHAETGKTRLAANDVDRLADAALEFLCMWLAGLVMDDRAAAVNLRDIEERIAALDREIKAPKPGTDLRQLHKARAEYVAVSERHYRMASRRKALDAAMISMPDQMEEIYQTIMTTPATEDVGGRLDEAITRLRLQEDIEADLAGEIESALPGIVAPLRRPAAARPAAVAARSA